MYSGRIMRQKKRTNGGEGRSILCCDGKENVVE